MTAHHGLSLAPRLTDKVLDFALMLAEIPNLDDFMLMWYKKNQAGVD
ncbi:MAG: hypothetical protein NTY09_09620 [bacterium]|nr:hypothetical protein [bacterium]